MVGYLATEQTDRDNAHRPAAGFQNSVSQRAHDPDAGASVDEIHVGGSQRGT